MRIVELLPNISFSVSPSKVTWSIVYASETPPTFKPRPPWVISPNEYPGEGTFQIDSPTLMFFPPVRVILKPAPSVPGDAVDAAVLLHWVLEGM